MWGVLLRGTMDEEIYALLLYYFVQLLFQLIHYISLRKIFLRCSYRAAPIIESPNIQYELCHVVSN